MISSFPHERYSWPNVLDEFKVRGRRSASRGRGGKVQAQK